MNELNINKTSKLLSEFKLYRESLDSCQPSKSNKQKGALLSLNLIIISWLGRQSLFQTFDEDLDFDLVGIREILSEIDSDE